ncbi:hypothetical protein F8388_006276 [Cannabis sativa]|uniref:Reverse transcriptase zinc-binding domain-containing protein n=1 Tax=Cannabis sativa TaxID=3483 RepID=A0A7J6G758_CANSA|nr:hypothetical protein F8388_006276 [Cannabis sativa]
MDTGESSVARDNIEELRLQFIEDASLEPWVRKRGTCMVLLNVCGHYWYEWKGYDYQDTWQIGKSNPNDAKWFHSNEVPILKDSNSKKRKAVGNVSPIVFQTSKPSPGDEEASKTGGMGGSFSLGSSSPASKANNPKKSESRKKPHTRSKGTREKFERHKEVWSSKAPHENNPTLMSKLVKTQNALRWWNSFVWKGILNARECVAHGSCSIIVNGESIDIWWQPWIPWMNYQEFRSVMETVRNVAPGLTCVADLIYRRTRSWNCGYLRFLFGNELGEEIGKIQIVKQGDEDFLIWKILEQALSLLKVPIEMHNYIDLEKVHPRLSMMLWRVCANVLPTGDIFSPPVSNNCCFCGSPRESPIHLFARCSFASALWFGSPFPVRIDSIQDDNIAGLLVNLCNGVEEELRCKMLCCFAILFDTIWNTRNRIAHERNVSWSVDQARREIHNRFSEFSAALVSASSDPGVASAPAVCIPISTDMRDQPSVHLREQDIIQLHRAQDIGDELFIGIKDMAQNNEADQEKK